jgi:hypothetical protein
VPAVGRRQRHSEFIGLERDDIEAMAKDKRLSRAERLKAVSEMKFLRVRNRQKRSR